MTPSVVLVHLSDIHFRRWRIDGSSYDVDADVRNELGRDAEAVCQRIGIAGRGIVVTGDMAYAADEREYAAAMEWLATLCRKIGCPREAVWTTPGNHDINRKTTDGHVTTLVQAELRRDPSSLDRLLADETGARTLFEPLRDYNEFAAAFQCDLGAKQLVWRKDLLLNDGSALRLCGLNSTLTSSRLDDPDQKLLVLGDISHCLPREDGVAYLSLCHHSPDLLKDGDSTEDLLANRVHVQLFGHKHAQRVRTHGNMLRIVAGATHPSRGEKKWEPRYNVLSIKVVARSTARHLEVAVFARRWEPERMQFVADGFECGKEETVWEIPLDPWTPPTGMPGSSPTVHAALASSEAQSMDAARRLTYRFLTLPHHKRIEVAQSLRLIADEDGGLPDRELFTRFFKRASDRHQLSKLWCEVEKWHADATTEANPFEGR